MWLKVRTTRCEDHGDLEERIYSQQKGYNKPRKQEHLCLLNKGWSGLSGNGINDPTHLWLTLDIQEESMIVMFIISFIK